MKILVTGACGQLGSDMVLELVRRGHDVIASDVNLSGHEEEKEHICWLQMDITVEQEVHDVLLYQRPEAIIHCAAWTQVDAAELPDNLERVYGINAEGTRFLAEACSNIGAKMLYISTDYVFDGQGSDPWEPDYSGYAPLNVYGKSKLEGEAAIAKCLASFFIVRIAWVFGNKGPNFVRTMLKVGQTHDVVRVVNDQIGTPTYTFDLAKLLADMIISEQYGYYHATNDEDGQYISWADFAKEIYHQAGMSVQVIPVTTEEYGLSLAKRPYNSRLDKRKIQERGFAMLPDWRDALHRYLISISE